MAHAAASDYIPLFPLPSIVFFPRTFLPIHVFEPRYREMVSDCMAGERVIGMVLLREGWEAGYRGNPPIYGVGCLGRMVDVRKLEDGRFNVLLRGLERFTIREERFDRSYRQARVEAHMVDQDPVATLPDRLTRELMDATRSYFERSRQMETFQEILDLDLDRVTLLHTLSMGLDLTVIEKQFLLEAGTLESQGKRLLELLHFRSLEQRAGGSGPRHLGH
ncbi:MAG: hypothetical protein A2V83_02285 [Nitrospirae bacterium RBG_16_64_22]|nr:MAG: hypothetical protein A2V83_02285 [Nitrospirae bacterium RBG_16_64_22]